MNSYNTITLVLRGPIIFTHHGTIPLHLRNTVGNGGFSLRSKRLLDLTRTVPFDQLRLPTKVEDVLICHFLFDALVTRAIKFASQSLAARFSIEAKLDRFGQSLDNVFGFHGKDWLPRYRSE